MSLRSEGPKHHNKEGTHKTFARVHPQRHGSNVTAYVPPETSKININGKKPLPEDLHMGAK